MERLTEKYNGKNIVKPGYIAMAFKIETVNRFEGEAVDKLSDYEDAEEQGLLLRLPCKVGDTVYLIRPNSDRKIIPRTADMVFLSVLWEDYGKEWFLTKAEAEQKLKEMEND